MDAQLAYVLNASRSRLIETQVAAGVRPCPDFIAILRHGSGRLITYDDSRRMTDAHLWRQLQRLGLTHWSCPRAVFTAQNNFTAVLAAVETVGLPLAIHAYNNLLRTPVNIITHGFLHNEGRALRSLAGYDRVRFLCLSEAIRRQLIDKFSLPTWQVYNTGYGVDTEFFSPGMWPDGQPPLIVSAGAANRDYQTLVRAASGLSVTVFIAADSPWTSVEPRMLPDSLPKNVELRSCGDYLTLRRLYAQALFVVVPLLQVPFAAGYTVIAEAMAMGKAVITTQSTYASDCVIDGETGYYANVGDVEDLRDKIRDLINNPLKARRMGARAREHVGRQFSHEAYYRRLRAAMAVDTQAL